MAKITHPSMRQRGRDSSAQNSVPPTKNYIVEDETSPSSNEETEIDEHLRQFEAPSQPPRQDSASNALPDKTAIPVPVDPKKTLESLIFTGRMEKDVEIFDNTYRVTTLSHKEHNYIVKALYNFGDTSDLFTIRVLTLASALKSINDVLLDDIEVPGDFESVFDRKKEIIDNLQLSVVEKLYDEYSGLIEEGDKLISEKEIKKS